METTTHNAFCNWKPELLDEMARTNVPRVNGLLLDVFDGIDTGALSRNDMARRFAMVARELGYCSMDRYTAGPVVVRGGATTWAYIAELLRNGEPVGSVEVAGSF
ncbi:hypothetical protein SAMN05216466_106152 [Paraburkholderia phenazinium]|uniref:Uncharacterized protein n=1 Tax=Paraburkholderia phenazinium TaxID=60549 RepID=A0A1G7YEQ6_9BURK|nr:hypothetical protein [Paraburkholderia phenazinium]SDG94834.1 hypothetical protein SAMN05216466_106152 [Paraburkholderia phenazinium]